MKLSVGYPIAIRGIVVAMVSSMAIGVLAWGLRQSAHTRGFSVGLLVGVVASLCIAYWAVKAARLDVWLTETAFKVVTLRTETVEISGVTGLQVEFGRPLFPIFQLSRLRYVKQIPVLHLKLEDGRSAVVPLAGWSGLLPHGERALIAGRIRALVSIGEAENVAETIEKLETTSYAEVFS